MAVILMTSGSGAPGVTTTSLAMALRWHRRVLMVEADPAGSCLVPGWLGGAYDGSRSLLNVIVGLSNGHRASDLIGAQQVAAPEPFNDASATFLLGWLNPAQANSASGLWGTLGSTFAQMDDAEVDVIIDAGRATQGSWPVELLNFADQVVMVCRGTHVSAVRTAPTLEAMRQTLTAAGSEDKLGLMVVGERDASAGEIAKTLKTPLLAALPDDPKAARVFSDGFSGVLREASATNLKPLHRSKLWAQVQSAAVAASKAAQAHRAMIQDREDQR